jgi:CubicO group peptidase (beta-lactamase class C family)
MLSLSPLDFARFGLLMLHEGRWGDRQLIRKDLVDLMLHSPVGTDVPMTSGQETPMLPDQRSFGSDTRNDTVSGPGIYSFTWWLNKPNPHGRQLAPALPEDAYFALGSMGNMLCVVPSLDLVVVWMRSRGADAFEAFVNPDTYFNQATKMLAGAIVDSNK